MPGETNYQYIVTDMQSPLDSDVIKSGDTDKLYTHIDNFLEAWNSDNGLLESKAGQDAFSYLNGSDSKGHFDIIMSMLPSMEPLLMKGMCGGGDAFPSVEDMIETGSHIYIQKPDGSVTTYTNEFLRNKTVDEFREMEKHGRPVGRTMIAHLALFLTESKGNGKLKKTGNAFKGLNPGDNASRVFILPKGDDPMLLNTLSPEMEADFKAKESTVNNLTETIKKLQLLISEKQQSCSDLEQQAGDREFELIEEYGDEAPEVPPAPREKSGFRRFLCLFGFPHSAAYTESKRVYDEASQKKQDYDTKQNEIDSIREQIDKLKAEVEFSEKTVEDAKNSLETAMEEVRNCEANAFVEKAGAALPKIIELEERHKKQKAYADEFEADRKAKEKEKEFRHEKKEIISKLLNVEAVEEIDKAQIPELGLGSTAASVDLINRGVSERLNLAAINGMDFQLSEVLLERSEAKNYMDKVMALRKLAKEATDPEDKKKALEQYTAKREELANEYRNRIINSKKLFEKTFGMKPTQKNVQNVMNALGFEKMVHDRIKKVDDPKTDDTAQYNARFTLPKVTNENVNQMTLLLMGGIKTAIREGLIKTPGIAPIKELSAEEGEKKIAEQNANQEKKEQEAWNDYRANVRGIM